MKILCTGASGFIGSHLVEALLAAGHDVTAFCFYNSRGDKGWLSADCRVVFGDVRDSAVVTSAVMGNDVVFHLAALIGIPYSYEAYRSYAETNIGGTLNVLEACQRWGSRLICTSTSEVYGSCQIAPMSETHPLSAQSPYAATKIAADQLALSFHRSFGTPVTIVRPFNTYGPRQSLRALIPALITQIIDAPDGGEVSVGNFAALRDWVFVDDTVRAFLAAMENFHAGEVIHVGTGVAWRVSAVANLIAGLLRKRVNFVVDQERMRPDASEVDKLIADNTRASELLKWSPQTPMLVGLEKTIEWFSANRHRYPESGYVV